MKTQTNDFSLLTWIAGYPLQIVYHHLYTIFFLPLKTLNSKFGLVGKQNMSNIIINICLEIFAFIFLEQTLRSGTAGYNANSI